MALAIRFQRLIREGAVVDQADLARLGHVSRARVTQIMNLLQLAHWDRCRVRSSARLASSRGRLAGRFPSLLIYTGKLSHARGPPLSRFVIYVQSARTEQQARDTVHLSLTPHFERDQITTSEIAGYTVHCVETPFLGGDALDLVFHIFASDTQSGQVTRPPVTSGALMSRPVTG